MLPGAQKKKPFFQARPPALSLDHRATFWLASQVQAPARLQADSWCSSRFLPASDHIFDNQSIPDLVFHMFKDTLFDGWC